MNYSYDCFHVKISLKLFAKLLLHWVTKFEVKQPVECPQQFLANYGYISWKAFEPLKLFFEVSMISWFIWQSIFYLFLVPQLDYSTMFRKSNVNITVYFFLVLKYRKVITIKSFKSKKKKLA